MKISYYTALVLAALLLSVVEFTMADLRVADQLADHLASWNQRANKIEALQASINTLEVLSEPDTTDRFWWNPLWRASRVRQLQHYNELILNLQHLDAQQQSEQAIISKLSEEFIQYCLSQTDHLPATLVLWQKVDAWRFSQLEHTIDNLLGKLTVSGKNNQALFARRQQQLQQVLTRSKSLTSYLRRRVEATTGKEQLFYHNWLKQFLAKTNQIESTLLQQSQIDKDND